MSIQSDVKEAVATRQMVLFFVVDVSGSMNGTKIGAVNEAIRSVLPELVDMKDKGEIVDLKIACLMFSNGCKWMFDKPLALESFKNSWQELKAGGGTDLGAACTEIASKLSENEFLNGVQLMPAIFLMSDGHPTDNFANGLNDLKKNEWFALDDTIKVAVAIGDDADKNALAEFTGNIEAVITVHTPKDLIEWIKFASVHSSQIGSKNHGGFKPKQQMMIDEIKEKKIEQQDADPDATDIDNF